MRIAIVGAGISGLTAAHLLHRRHELTIFEAADHIGGHTNTVSVEIGDERHDVDTGFIVLNDRNYPNFTRLLERLGVGTQLSDMSFSVSAEAEDFEFAGTPRGLFAQRGNLLSPRFLRMVGEYVRFNRHARELLRDGDETVSLGRWLDERGYSEYFINRLIVPQASAVWSADPAQMWSFPALFMARFFEAHGMLGLRGRPAWRTVTGGSHAYVHALLAPMRERVRINAPVTGVRRHEDHVEVRVGDAAPERFDAVVIGAHADQALAMLDDPTEAERELLGAIPYARNEALLHTDARLLPRRRPAWASWNYHLLAQPSGLSTVTYHMNRLQSLRSRHELCVTLNRSERVDPAKVLRRIDYAHPVFTADGWAAQRRHEEISGVNRTHYCGAYWRWGFHEDGVISGLRVARALGGEEL